MPPGFDAWGPAALLLCLCVLLWATGFFDDDEDE